MKVLNIRIWHMGVMSLLMGGIIGCTTPNYLGLAQPPVTPIRELVKPSETESQAIYIQGKVINRAPFMGSGSYQLQDETGTVWVLTNGNLPKTGETIMIKGAVAYKSIPVDGHELGELYILEEEKLDGQAQIPDQPTQPDVDDLLLPHKRNTK